MKNQMKVTLIALAAIIMMTSFLGCKPEVIIGPQDPPFTAGKDCNGEKILAFASISDLQSEYNLLADDFLAAGGDEQKLRDWETSKNFYSLRTKDERMDDGLIPYEPDFDSWNYTSNEVFEAMLSASGMIIINNELYMWSDGCQGLKTPFACSKIGVLVTLENHLSTYASLSVPDDNMTASIISIMHDNDVSFVDLCDDVRFDFETIHSGIIGEVNYQNPGNLRDQVSSCGTLVNTILSITSNDPLTQKATVRIEAQGLHDHNPMYLIGIDDPLNAVKIVNGSNSSFINMAWNLIPNIPFLDIQGYPGKWVEVEVDYSSQSILKIYSVMITGPLSSICIANDGREIDLNCPLFLNYPFSDASTGEYHFSIEGMTPNQIGNALITWEFGDGSTTQTNAAVDVHHTYTLPCFSEEYTVSATINKPNGMCKTVLSETIKIVNSCATQYVALSHKQKISGKRAKVKTVFKYNATFGFTKFKNKFRWRKNGDKYITPSPSMTFNQVIGSTCTNGVSHPLGSAMSNGKKTLKQNGFYFGQKFIFNRNDTYEIEFSHSNPSFTPKKLIYTKPCL